MTSFKKKLRAVCLLETHGWYAPCKLFVTRDVLCQRMRSLLPGTCKAGAGLVGAVGDWELCGERFYAREELYQMAWGDLRLDYLRCSLVGSCCA